eukprot:UN19535
MGRCFGWFTMVLSTWQSEYYHDYHWKKHPGKIFKKRADIHHHIFFLNILGII